MKARFLLWKVYGKEISTRLECPVEGIDKLKKKREKCHLKCKIEIFFRLEHNRVIDKFKMIKKIRKVTIKKEVRMQNMIFKAWSPSHFSYELGSLN